MDSSKSKLQITNGKGSKVKLGASTSSEPSPLKQASSKKSYKKQSAQPADFGSTGFGLTGMTGES